jgi:hypothetical protein
MSWQINQHHLAHRTASLLKFGFSVQIMAYHSNPFDYKEQVIIQEIYHSDTHDTIFYAKSKFTAVLTTAQHRPLI